MEPVQSTRELRALALEDMDSGDPESMTELILGRLDEPHVPIREILRWTANR